MLALPLLCLAPSRTKADSKLDNLQKMIPVMEQRFSVPLTDWRFARPDTDGQQLPGVDDSQWQSVSPHFSWVGEHTKVWFRKRVVIPETIGGQLVEGRPVRLDLFMDDDGELYINGALKEAFHWDECKYTLTQHAHAGDVYEIAVRGINTVGPGEFRSAALFCDVVPEFSQYVTEAQFVELLQSHVSAADHTRLQDALSSSEARIRFTEFTDKNTDEVRSQIAAAHEQLTPVASITRQGDVYYVGHAHIDMNWLWTWPETIDVCHRTWNSAMNMMDEFPDFGFVQSQPGAYAPIEAQYPDEFARMKAMQKGGRWDLVGGLWDESDTNMPSGEALARSLFLGQRYFKSRFGQYASTGWLPDSFGHSWQLPQLFRLAGIDSFYHMRCGNGMPFTWWEAPDGSRVLKANTADSYNSPAELKQLVEPRNNATQYRVPQTFVAFGVGDHGGGPTREQIIKAKSFQNDPLLPRVHMATADVFFKQLAKTPAAASLPVVSTDLQYVFEGCYTSHADLKKAVRSSENNLYSAETLSSLAAMTGSQYPTAAFDEAWKPTTFAQFHDIMCGTAIHSTYDWMFKELEPAFKFEQKQTATALHSLSANIDTRGPGSQALVIWNTLSFTRDDIVRVPLANANQFPSVVDQSGHLHPAQADGGSLVFVARAVPGFGHKVYFPSRKPCASEGLTLKQTPDAYSVESRKLAVRIDKASGAISKLTLKPANWSVFGDAADGNTFQMLGEFGNTWVINYYKDADKRLLKDGAMVTLAANGPVYSRIRVTHTFGKSKLTQDITVYASIDRIDVPTVVDWHEHNQTAKIRMPVNAAHPVARCEIPYGSIERPTTGQECPGQKWMDVTDETPNAVTNATPIDLSTHLNDASTDNFDRGGYAYPADKALAAGVHELGNRHIPFNLATGTAGRQDNVLASGQTITLPSEARGDTLYLLGSCASGGRSGALDFRYANGRIESRAFNLNDWVAGAYINEIGIAFPNRTSPKPEEGVSPKLWIVAVPIPAGKPAAIRLPINDKMHIFAATIATAASSTPQYGLSILNDCKYGFDVNGSVFRLTALRSSGDPDPNPEEGTQEFTYSLYPHAKDWRAARSEEEGLNLNIPLKAAVTGIHAPGKLPPAIDITNIGPGDVVAGALKHSADGDGYILRIFETHGRNTQVKIAFSHPVKVEETDILERPIRKRTISTQGNAVAFPVSHDQIVTLHITGI